MNVTSLLRIAAILLGLGVGAGAFAAHGLREVLTEYGHTIWQKAVFYQMVHALALFAMAPAVKLELVEARKAKIAAGLFIVGVLLFSGSLYVLALSGVTWLGAITPFGGVSFLVGWLLLALSRPIGVRSPPP